MRESLKNLFSNTIILSDGSQYRYSIQPFELTNSLGNATALLQQYTFSINGEENDGPVIKLYRTKEGNWYDLEQPGALVDMQIVRMLKSAIDKKEGENILI